MDDSARLWQVFLDVQRGLPRQGPGCADATRQALSLCRDLPDQPNILDIGCGPGMQTMVLAQLLDGHITAVDIHEEYLNILRSRIASVKTLAQVEVLARDMNDLGFAPEDFDLVWSEGAAYIMGFQHALAAWRPLLKPGGYLAVTELVWLTPDPSAEAAAFFNAEYLAMTDVAGVAEMFREQGYDLAGHFTVPDNAWWDDYYTPLEAKLPALRETYQGDDEALGVVEATQREIEMRRSHGECYGYEFFVGQVGR